MTIRTAWRTLISFSGALQKKRVTLFNLLVEPPRAWAARLLTMAEDIIQINGIKETAMPRTRGELEQQHGMAEAQELVDDGLYQ